MSELEQTVVSMWPHGHEYLFSPNGFGVQLRNHPENFRFGIHVTDSTTERDVCAAFKEWARGWQDQLSAQPITA